MSVGDCHSAAGARPDPFIGAICAAVWTRPFSTRYIPLRHIVYVGRA